MRRFRHKLARSPHPPGHLGETLQSTFLRPISKRVPVKKWLRRGHKNSNLPRNLKIWRKSKSKNFSLKAKIHLLTLTSSIARKDRLNLERFLMFPKFSFCRVTNKVSTFLNLYLISLQDPPFQIFSILHKIWSKPPTFGKCMNFMKPLEYPTKLAFCPKILWLDFQFPRLAKIYFRTSNYINERSKNVVQYHYN